MSKLLMVVDYQADFVDGALGFPGAEALDAPIADRIRRAREEGWEVLFTLDTHGEDYLATQEGRRLPVEHCAKGTAGHCLYGETGREARPEDVRIEKGALGSKELLHYLEKRSYDEIELIGLVSNMCVLSNAIICKAALPEARVAVREALTRSFDSALHEKAMDVLRGAQVDVI